MEADTNPDSDIFQRAGLVLGTDVLAALGKARVALFGVGGVGSWCAEGLVRTGVRHLTIVDSDRVVASNVNRQLMATSETIGELKVDALKRRLLAINPAAEIECRAERYDAETAETFNLVDYDFVIDAIDSVDCKAQLIRHALLHPSVTLFSSMGAARRLDPLRVRSAEFWKIQGDGLARALRGRFRKSGDFPQRRFMCVYSDEPPASQGLGSIVQVTAVFGFALTSMVVSEVCHIFRRRAENMV